MQANSSWFKKLLKTFSSHSNFVTNNDVNINMLVDDDAGSIACLCLNDYNFKSNIEYSALRLYARPWD